MYDPALGRFMTLDPLAENFYSWSPYTYSFNNPIRFVDPDGMGPYDEILDQVAEQENIHIGYNVVHNNETGVTTITQTSIQEHPDKFSPIEKGEVNYQQTTNTYTIGSDGELASVSTATSDLQVSVSAKGEMASDGYNIEGVTKTTEMSYADAAHQPDQIKEFAKDPIVAGVSAIKASGNGRDAFTQQDNNLPYLSLTDRTQNAMGPIIQGFGVLTGTETPGVGSVNWDRDRQTRLTFSQEKAPRAAKRLKRFVGKTYPILN